MSCDAMSRHVIACPCRMAPRNARSGCRNNPLQPMPLDSALGDTCPATTSRAHWNFGSRHHTILLHPISLYPNPYNCSHTPQHEWPSQPFTSLPLPPPPPPSSPCSSLRARTRGRARPACPA